jgi:hypothetical protein
LSKLLFFSRLTPETRLKVPGGLLVPFGPLQKELSR